jgi:serine/threonine-protein kinase
VPDLLRDIVGAVVEVMNIKRSGTEQESPTMRSIDAGAYELYAKGRYSLNTLTADGLAEGLDHLKAAVDRDPNQPLLLAGVALAYILIAHQASIVLVADPFQLAKPYVNRAMELDPMLPEAHQALAEINAYRDWDFSGAEAEYRRALHLSNGNLPDAHANYSWYLMLYGRTGEQLAEMKAALDLEPLNPVYHVWMGQQYAADGRWDDAMTECRRALDLNSAIPDGLVLLGNLHAQKGMLDEAVAYHQKAASIDTGLSTYALACTYARLGRHEEARRIRDQLRNRPRHWDTLGLAAIHAALDEKDEAMRWLEAMYQQRHMFTPWLKVGPEFVGLHADPRFQSLMARVGVER